MANEKRLIDANALISKLEAHRNLFIDAWGSFSQMPTIDKVSVDTIDTCIADVVNAPTVDAVEVVRCKDCDHRHDSCFAGSGNTYCDFHHKYFPLDGFCSYGERKDNG